MLYKTMHIDEISSICCWLEKMLFLTKVEDPYRARYHPPLINTPNYINIGLPKILSSCLSLADFIICDTDGQLESIAQTTLSASGIFCIIFSFEQNTFLGRY